MGTKYSLRPLRSSLFALISFLSIFLGSIYFLDHYAPEDPFFTSSLLPELMFRTVVSFDFYLVRLRNLVNPPHVRVLELTTGFMTTKALYVACKYKLPDLLHKNPLSTYDLALATHTNPKKLVRVMQHLQVQGIFKLNFEKKWANTHLSWALQSSNPNNVIAEVLDSIDTFYTTFSDLSDHIKSSSSSSSSLSPVSSSNMQVPFFSRSDSPFFINSTRVFRRTYSKPDSFVVPPSKLSLPAFSKSVSHTPFQQLFKAWVEPWDPTMDYRFEKFKFKRVCDVQYGFSSFLPLFLKKVPTSIGIIFDDPFHLNATQVRFQHTYPELSHRVQFVHAQLPKDLPKADAYIFRDTLNSMNTSWILELLQVVHTKAKLSGKQQLRLYWSDYELDLPYPYISPFISHMDLMFLLSSFQGHIRTVEEREQIFKLSGFEPIVTRRRNSMYAITEAKLA